DAEASHTSDTDTLTATGTNLWLGGHKTFGVAVTLPIVGGVVSTTRTVDVHEDGLPAVSEVENLTGVVTATLKNGGALLEMLSDGVQISVTDAPPRNAEIAMSFAAVPPLALHSTVIGAGQVIDGAIVSRTCTCTLDPIAGHAARSFPSSR